MMEGNGPATVSVPSARVDAEVSPTVSLRQRIGAATSGTGTSEVGSRPSGLTSHLS